MKPMFNPSLMCMDLLNIKEQLQILNTRADFFHVDIMDGHYCKNITLSPDMVKAFKKVSKVPLDVHLMTTNPELWINTVAEAGADIISLHAETINGQAFRLYNQIRELGLKTGLVLNPATPLSEAAHYLGRIDLLTIMTVDVGFAGQPFIEEMLDKIAEAKRLREENGYHYRIQIDGSCKPSTFKRLMDAGADVLILGSSGLFGLDQDLHEACRKMTESYRKALEGSEVSCGL